MYLESILPEGLRLTSGTEILRKHDGDKIGMSIGGGYPFCPNIYIGHINDTSKLEVGDEILSINGTDVVGYSQAKVAKLIKESKDEVVINYNKIHLDNVTGYSFDMMSKKLKHMLIDKMDVSFTENLGISRAILVNERLSQRVNNIEKKAVFIRNFIKQLLIYLKANKTIGLVYQDFGHLLQEIGIRESEIEMNNSLCKLGQLHLKMDKNDNELKEMIEKMIDQLKIFVSKQLSDFHLSLSKYKKFKFEFLAFCLKVKQLDDEEYYSVTMKEPLQRLQTGNYDYRVLLRHRKSSQRNFLKLDRDLLVKIDLLENNFVQCIMNNLKDIIGRLIQFSQDKYSILEGINLTSNPNLIITSEDTHSEESPVPSNADNDDNADEESNVTADEVDIEYSQDASDSEKSELLPLLKGTNNNFEEDPIQPEECGNSDDIDDNNIEETEDCDYNNIEETEDCDYNNIEETEDSADEKK